MTNRSALYPEPKLHIEAKIDGRLQSIEIPQYALRFPNFDRVCLPVVKNGIYNPRQASTYKCRIDDFNNKPPIENARTSTNLNGFNFIQDTKEKRPQTCVAEPISLIGDVEISAQKLADKDKPRSLSANPALLSKINNESTYKLVNCVAGRENCIRMPEEKVERVFRFNRVRSVMPDRPTQGHQECYFDTTPVIDKFGRRVEAATYSKYRESNPYLIKSKEPFKPYGYTSSQYKNYIMYHPRM